MDEKNVPLELYVCFPQGAEPVCECVHTEAEKLQKEGTKLRLETKEIRRTLRQHR